MYKRLQDMCVLLAQMHVLFHICGVLACVLVICVEPLLTLQLRATRCPRLLLPCCKDARAALRLLKRIQDLVCPQCKVGSGGHTVG